MRNNLSIYSKKRVFITGHTGFKGSWLSFWLQQMGAEVFGYSLPLSYSPTHLSLLKLDIPQVLGDIRDKDLLSKTLKGFRPDIVFHMAAQPLVRYSYHHPLETYETNVMGTLNILEAGRGLGQLKAIVNITTDKCYENKEWLWGYRESDPMGGFDPYSSSKACAEILISSYRNSFFHLKDFQKSHQCLISSVRAGNVIGGGDWSEDRLIPDMVRSIEQKKSLEIRSPLATRPWQHVLEPLHGYLMLGEKLLEGRQEFAQAWNFGPDDFSVLTVENLLRLAKKYWDRFDFHTTAQDHPHEAHFLKLDSSKAAYHLGWKPVWSVERCLQKTMEWYRDFMELKKVNTENNLKEFLRDLASSQEG